MPAREGHSKPSGEEINYRYGTLNRMISAVTMGPEWYLNFVHDGFGNKTAQSLVKGAAPVKTLGIHGMSWTTALTCSTGVSGGCRDFVWKVYGAAKTSYYFFMEIRRRVGRLALAWLLSGTAFADIGFITYVGGSGTDRSFGVATDAAGNVYTTGTTTSRDFPVRSALQPTFAGGAADAFVAKLNPAGQVVWATYFGGSGQDDGVRVELDREGNVYVVGFTRSADFPTTANAFQKTLKGTSDAYLLKLSPNGDRLLFSTLLGGTGDESAPALLVDAAGMAAVGGSTDSPDLTTTGDAVFKTNQGGFDAYVAVIDPAGGRLVYLSYFGGSGNDTLNGMALGRGGNIYFTGQTASTNLPVSDSAYQRTARGNGDAYLVRLSADKRRAEYITYLGGSAADSGADVNVDFSENVFVSGVTSSTDLPIFPAGTTRYFGGNSDVFLAQFAFIRGEGPGGRLAAQEGGSARALGFLVNAATKKPETGEDGGEFGGIATNNGVWFIGTAGNDTHGRAAIATGLTVAMTFNSNGAFGQAGQGLRPCTASSTTSSAGFAATGIGFRPTAPFLACMAPGFSVADIAISNGQMLAGLTDVNLTTGAALPDTQAVLVFDRTEAASDATNRISIYQGVSDQGTGSDPVATSTGELLEHEPDLALGGALSLSFIRYYATNLAPAGLVRSALGPNWMHNFDCQLLFNQARTQAFVQLFRGKAVIFSLVNNVWQPITIEPFNYQFAADGQLFRFFDPNEQLIYTFTATQRLGRIDDLNGNALLITQSANGPLEVADGLGRRLTFTYSGTQLARVTDQGGRNIEFTYSGANLASVTHPDGKRVTYDYTAAGTRTTLMTRRTMPEGNIPIAQEFDGAGRVVRQSDSRGNAMTYAYNTPSPRVTTITDPTGAATRHRATTNHLLAEVIDPAGNSTSLEHDLDGRRSGVSDRIGAVTGLLFEPGGNPIVQVAADGSSTRHTYSQFRFNAFTFQSRATTAFPDGSSIRYNYDSRGNLTSFMDRANQTWTFTYNERGWPTGSRSPRGATTAIAYNTDGTPSSLVLPTGETIRYEYDSLKRPSKIIRGDGSSRQFAYDARDRLTSLIDERGKITTHTYDGNGRRTARVNRAGETTRTFFDGDNRMAERANPLDQAWRFAYDPVGRPASVSDPSGVTLTRTRNRLGYVTSIADPAGVIASLTYNAEGVPATISNGEGQTWRIQSDLRRRITAVTDPAGNSASRTFDSMSRVSSVTDATAATRRVTYDSAGRLQRLTDAEGNSAVLAYDADSRLERVTDRRGNNWTLTLDTAGRITARTDPAGRTHRYEYNPRGLLSRTIRPDDTTAEYTYDEAARLIRQTYSDGTVVTYNRDDLGRVVRANGVTLTYDAAGRIVESNGIRNEYDAAGRITAIFYAPDRAIRYTYNNRGFVSRMTDWNGRAWDIEYDNALRITAIRRPNGTVSSFTYGPDGRRNGVRHSGEKLEASVTIERDAAGRVTRALRNIPSVTVPAAVSDSTTAVVAAANALPDFSPSVQELSRLPDNRMEGYEYDARGNLLRSGDRQFFWNGRDRLTRAVSPSADVAFEFDAFGYPIRIGEATYVWNYAIRPPMLTAIRREAGAAAPASKTSRLAASSTRQPREGTFVLPHVLEVGGVIQNTSLTFDTSLFTTYTGGVDSGAAGSANLELYSFHGLDGTILYTGEDGRLTGGLQVTPKGEIIFADGTVPAPVVYDNVLAHPEVRLAFSAAMDRENPVSKLTASPSGIRIMDLPSSWTGNAIDLPTHEYDPEAAAELLEQAGWVMGDDGMRRASNVLYSDAGSQPLHFELTPNPPETGDSPQGVERSIFARPAGQSQYVDPSQYTDGCACPDCQENAPGDYRCHGFEYVRQLDTSPNGARSRRLPFRRDRPNPDVLPQTNIAPLPQTGTIAQPNVPLILIDGDAGGGNCGLIDNLAIQELSVPSNGFGPAFGSSGGGSVNFISRPKRTVFSSISGYGLLVVGGSDTDNVPLQGFLCNATPNAFDLSVLGFNPVLVEK